MDKIFYPESVAVIGVSERPGNLAAFIIKNLLQFGYQGDIYAVGLREGTVHGIPILSSVDALPDGVDLAVILTPARTVPGLLDECGRKGIRWAIIESGGFSEFSAAGRELEEQLLEIARRWEMRFVGPNCISVINAENGLCLPFADLDPRSLKRGSVSVVAQSGGVSITYAMLLSEAGVGVNKVVSMGNKADLDEVDYLRYLLDDPGTEVIILYLESITEGRRLMELLAASPKPVIVHKANRGEASTAIAISHTAAMANDDRIVDAALRQVGAARALRFSEGVALAQGFTLPPVRGADIVVISRSGGHAVIAADALADNGFRLAPVPDELRRTVERMFPPDVISLTNPLDLGVLFDFDLYGLIIEEAFRAIAPDALLLIHTYSAHSEGEMARRLARRLQDLSRELDKPLAFCAYTQHEEVERLRREVTLPVFDEVETAVRALAASRDRHARRRELPPLPPKPKRRPPEVAGLLIRDAVLTADATLGLCEAYEIPTGQWGVVTDEESAALAAGMFGYPVALKILSPDVPHRSDIGGVVLNLRGAQAVRQEYAALLERFEQAVPDGRLNGVLVQKMLPGGVEVILGGKRDPSFGPVVMFGLGGVYVELFQDVSFRLAPLTRADAEEMVAEVHGSRLLRGLRGRPPADVEAVIEALVNLSRLLVECPEVVEIDINPLLVFEQGVAAVDGRAVVRRRRRKNRTGR